MKTGPRTEYTRSKYYEKYGEQFLEIEECALVMGKPWDTFIIMFDEFDTIASRYRELLSQYLEDLKLYALMHRNVYLPINGILDIAFFVSKEKEIKGYKNRIYSANATTKEKLLRYYYEYLALFEMYCLNQDFMDKKFLYQQMRSPLRTISNSGNFLMCVMDYNAIKDRCFGGESGLINFTEKQCDLLLENIGELENAYSNNKYHIEKLLQYDDKTAFVKNIIMPFYYKGECGQLIRDFVANTIKNANFDLLSPDLIEKGKRLLSLKDIDWVFVKNAEIEELQKEYTKLMKPIEDIHHKILIIRGKYSGDNISEEEKSRLDSFFKENKSRICSIDNKELQLKEQLHQQYVKDYETFIDEVCPLLINDTSIWGYMFKHQTDFDDYISSIYKRKYIKCCIHEITKKCLKHVPMNESQLGRPERRLRVFVDNFDNYDYSDETFIEYTISESEKSLRRHWVRYIKAIAEKDFEKERKAKEEEEKKRKEEEERRRKEEEKRLEQYRFNIRNRYWRDQELSFREADHIYIVDGTPLDSVTTFVKNCFPEFNAEFHAKRKAESLGITKKEVLEMWERQGRESREQGTSLHKKIEAYYLGKNPSSDDTFELFKIFANKITLKPYRTEWAVYDWDQKIAGTIDFVDYQNDEYIIYDWKRSDKLIAKNGLPIKASLYGEKALSPIAHLDDSPYYHYALQLSLYKYILEKNYDITVSKLRLGIFHPSYNKPYVLEMPYLQNEIDILFNLRSEVIF